ncbi:MAG: hypothetical protein NZM04_07550 [Methylacidiphilales bacterium]|nr:hypothetical protein [Candidatus Methylacidiphilales bacterium]MDW8349622.1 hypothetical protein [Verrucomicrobiae bacterium]
MNLEFTNKEYSSGKFRLVESNLIKKIYLALALGGCYLHASLTMASQYTSLAVKGDVTYTAKGTRHLLKPGLTLSVDTIIISGANGQAIIQLGQSFQVFQITSNTKAKLAATGVEKL